MNCYYVVASLPTLALGDPPPFPSSEVPVRLANVLESGQLEEVQLFVQGREAESRTAFARQWLEMDTQLRNFCARLRAAKKGVESRRFERWQQGYAVWLERAVADAYARPNPFEREMALDRCRWKILDELTRERPFSFDVVLAWILKLRMVERWAALADEAGRRRFEQQVAEMRKAATVLGFGDFKSYSE